MEEKAQVNLEYLLIVVGAVIIVTMVSIFIKGTASSITGAAQSAAADENIGTGLSE